MAQPAQDQLFLLLTLGTVGVLTLALFIIIFFFIYQKRIFILQQQKQKMEIEFQEQMSRSQLEAQEKDRRRIAADLHDSVGALLWGAKLHASFIERSVPLSPDAKESHQEMMGALDEAIETVRRIAWQLTPEVFEHAGLAKSLERLCKSVDGKGIKVTFECTEQAGWNDARALHVFRIVQELLSNSIKHAEASTITVSMAQDGAHLIVEVSDNGKGYEPAPSSEGVGWWSIQQRVKQVGAHISIGHPPMGTGLAVTLRLPSTP